uniref:Uncharacterized protein n=1 Tax=Rhizophora mucronata TaxID=61149 RepID=A0A2P2N8H2_RHIMU
MYRWTQQHLASTCATYFGLGLEKCF